MSYSSPSQHGSLRYRAAPAVSEAVFAGRLGGNQSFTANDESDKGKELLEKQPDAAPLTSLRASLSLSGFLDPDLWRQAIIEGWATCLLVFVMGAASSGLSVVDASPLAITTYAALLNTGGLALFVYAAGPVSGGHLNPSITMATFFTGLATLPRAVLYIAAQSTGAIVGGFWLRLGMGNAFFPTGTIPGCTVDASLVSPGQMFVLEFMFAQALLFLAFGVGLEPRQAKVFGAAYGPVLVAMTLGLATLAGSFIMPGFTGVSFNPARCLGLMTAKENMQYHYVHWLGPLAAVLLNGVFYQVVPPYVRDEPLLKRLIRRVRSAR